MARGDPSLLVRSGDDSSVVTQIKKYNNTEYSMIILIYVHQYGITLKYYVQYSTVSSKRKNPNLIQYTDTYCNITYHITVSYIGIIQYREVQILQ